MKILLAIVLAAIATDTGVYAVEPDEAMKERLHQLTPARDTAFQFVSTQRLTGSESGGAVLVPGPPGSFDSFSVGAPDVVFDGRIYRM